MHAKYVQYKPQSQIQGFLGQKFIGNIIWKKVEMENKKIISPAEEECQYQPNQNSLRLWSQIRNEFEFQFF